jgi:hypothetical protein
MEKNNKRLLMKRRGGTFLINKKITFSNFLKIKKLFAFSCSIIKKK